ncbi:MAG: hypothetical protein H6873_05555 [Hyphomicrobiaceae bacterium]|nr:hypothetical protein [Hyphomicrobiaceae bacterium]
MTQAKDIKATMESAEPVEDVPGPEAAPTDGVAEAGGGGTFRLPPADWDRLKRCAGLDQNDRDNARRLDEWSGENLMFVQGHQWLVWTGTHWKRDEGSLVVARLAQDLVDRIKLEPLAIFPVGENKKLLASADAALEKDPDARTPEEVRLIRLGEEIRASLKKQRQQRRNFAVSSGNATRTAAMLKQAESQKAVDQDRLDADPMAFNVLNGTLEFARIEDAENPDPDSVRLKGAVLFRAHRREDLMTKCAAVAYEPGADCPQFNAFLARVVPKPHMRRFLQVFWGYCLMGGNGEQKLLYNYGSGANGKSLMVDSLRELLGDYAATVSSETISGEGQRQSQQASPDLARLFNVRLASIDELPRGTPLKESFVKQVSGGTPILARHLLKEFFEFTPQFVPVMTGNDMPEIFGTDDGIWRRLLLMHWDVRIPDEEQVPLDEMKARFAAERPGILNWLIGGALEWLGTGLTPHIPAEVIQFVDEYRKDKDLVGEFAKVCLEPMPGNREPAKALYDNFVLWCEHNALRPFKQTYFGTRMGQLGWAKERSSTVFYTDCRLRDNLPHYAQPAQNTGR